ncbi:uncharacterized protein LOC121283204 isoform X3 [Carcharodon carcharias]|uniref:uncharacterized protein LOC121283204 isoform X3 n=1 Tax=Carcharodon carcharias TaxID=13397 RepID=UPI001B7F50CB|nr:uncharacterized protein LOC121283204 isoform X3 [Carcharodon carcharias]
MESAPGNLDSADLLSRNGEEGENKETKRTAEEDARMVEAKDCTLFEALCDTILSSLALLQSSITELLDFKDQLMNHALPTSLLAHLVITTGRLFCSVSDMCTPTTELIRLVRFYSTPWQQKKEILELLYADCESFRKKHQLGVAVRRLQLLDGHARWIARERQILNWEKLFGKLMTAKTHGRRWKFRVDYLKRKDRLSLESQLFIGTPAESEMRDGQIDSELHVVSEETESRQSLISSEDQKADAKERNEDEEDEKEDSDFEEAVVPVQKFSLEGESVLLKKDIVDGEAQTEGQTQEQGTWTGDALHQRFLCVTVTKFYGAFEQGLSCLFTYRQESHQIQLIQDPETKQNKKIQKQVKISAGKQDLPVTESTSGILKMSEAAKSDFAKSAMESVLTGTQGAKFELLMSGEKEDFSMLEVLLYRNQEGVIAKGEFRLPQNLVSEEEVQLLIKEHNLQLAQLQELHEKEMCNLLELLRSPATDSLLQQSLMSDVAERVLRSENAQSTAVDQSGDTETKEGRTFNRSDRSSRSSQTSPKPPQKCAAKKQKMSVWERMKVLEENMWRSKQSAIENLQSETRRNLEKQLSVQKRLHLHSDSKKNGNRSKDEICFPALFMPMKVGQVFTPKARLYFHPSGSAGFFRLTQAPSVISLPPLGSSTRVSVLKLLNPRVTLPITPAIEGNPTSKEEEKIVNKLISEPSPINHS